MIINILSFLEKSAAMYPDKVFLEDANKAVTFLEAETIGKRIGSYLARNVQGKSKPIAVFVGRDVESVLMFLGVVYSGNFYIPLNPALPEQRLKIMLESVDLKVILGKDECAQMANRLEGVFHEYSRMASGEVDEEELVRRRDSSLDTDPLYAMFTSGSTGIPKAVLIGHRSVIDLVDAFQKEFSLGADRVFGNQASLDFDISVKDIYCAMKCGGTVEIIPKELFSFPVRLIEYMNERKVNHAFWAVATLSIVARLKGMKKIRPLFLDRIMFSGEAISVKTLSYWQQCLPQTEMYNLYGPTEITCNCTYFKIDRTYVGNEKIPIGKPFRNTGILLLDDEKETAVGGIGEICVRGTSLALGYLNNPKKTSERFTQNPLNPNYPETIYRTGDLARYDEHGQLVFCGRKDYQIKHMGYRIELGDIEAAADSVSSIGRSCCLYDKAHDRIVLFYEADEDKDRELCAAMEARLPQYMMPNRYVRISVFPANYHGKIDRKKLEEEYMS